MEGEIEKNLGGSIFGEREKTPKPKGDEPWDDEDLTILKQSEAKREIMEEKLTRDAWKEYPKAMKEITNIASEKEINFKRIAIAADNKLSTSLKKPETIFIVKNYVENYPEATKLIPKDKIHQGLRTKFLEMRQELQEPQITNKKKLDEERENLKNIEDKKATDERNLIKKTFALIAKQINIENLETDFHKSSENTLSESEIQDQVNKSIIMNILYDGVKNSDVFKIFQLKDSKDKGKISFDDYDEKFRELTSPYFRFLRESFPKLNEETIQKLGEEWLKSVEVIGREHQKRKYEQNKYDYNKMHR